VGLYWCRPWLRNHFTTGTCYGILLPVAVPDGAAAETQSR